MRHLMRRPLIALLCSVALSVLALAWWVAVLNASPRPRVYIAGRVYEQKLTGRLVGNRKAHRTGNFPLFPGSLMVRRAQRMRQIIAERGLGGVLAKIVGRGRGATQEKT